MVDRDKNHPSVFVYSSGNEAGTGPAHYEMVVYVLTEEEADERLEDTFTWTDEWNDRYEGDLSHIEGQGVDPIRQLYH